LQIIEQVFRSRISTIIPWFFGGFFGTSGAAER